MGRGLPAEAPSASALRALADKGAKAGPRSKMGRPGMRGGFKKRGEIRLSTVMPGLDPGIQEARPKIQPHHQCMACDLFAVPSAVFRFALPLPKRYLSAILLHK
jgi:hypothetical protein